MRHPNAIGVAYGHPPHVRREVCRELLHGGGVVRGEMCANSVRPQVQRKSLQEGREMVEGNGYSVRRVSLAAAGRSLDRVRD